MSSGVGDKKGKDLNFKATELRLGLPGSESPERDNGHGHGQLLKGGGFLSRSKRGFADTMNVGGGGGSGKWGLSVAVGSDFDLINNNKNGGLFSPRSVNGAAGCETNTQKQSFMAKNVGVSQLPKTVVQEKKTQQAEVSAANSHGVAPPAAKAQVVGWPPIRSFRKNSMAINPLKTDEDADADAKSRADCLYVKVSMDGAPYLRKVDLKTYISYKDLSSALEKMFSCFTLGQCGTWILPNQNGGIESRLKDLVDGSEYVLTYEDKDGDWMLVGDVPWEMFTDTCKRLRIMKSSDAIGLAPRAVEKCRSHT